MLERRTRRSRRTSLTAIVIAAAAWAGQAQAQTSVCTQLETQLVALETASSAGNSKSFREYDQSVRQQQDEIDRASAAARRDRCVGMLFLPARDTPHCRELNARIAQMKQNLDRLVAARNRYTTDPSARARQRNEILHAMSVNRCAGAQARNVQRPANLLEALFGTSRVRDLGENQYFRGAGGTWRTLCVRSCDGYYFPISFSTVQSQFANDEQLCRARCPGTDVALYAYRNPGGEAESMVSLTGQPYTALPTAFLYRKEYVPSCTCGAAGGAQGLAASYPPPVTSPSALGGTPMASAAYPASPVSNLPGHAFDMASAWPPAPPLPLPPRRPNGREDPETMANRAGNLVFRRSVASEPERRVATLETREGVRIVGPGYYAGRANSGQALIPNSGQDVGAGSATIDAAGDETTNETSGAPGNAE